MSPEDKTLLIKRYASRRLYNTETSDYVTLEDIAGFIRDGRGVQIIDLKTGDDLTRQYLLQIIADHESRGENVLPLNVLMDLVRSYTTDSTSVVPEFLAISFDIMRAGQTQFLKNFGDLSPISKVSGFDAIAAQQEAFLKAMAQGFNIQSSGIKKPERQDDSEHKSDDLSEIKAQLEALQKKLNQLEA